MPGALESSMLRLQATVERWNTSLRRFLVLRVVLESLDAFNSDRMSLLAASLSYYALLALFPLLLLLIALASPFLAEASVIRQVVRTAENALPGAGAQIERVLREVVAARGSATFVGVIALFWSAAGFFDVIQTALDRAWRASQSRAFWQQRLISILVIALLAVLFVISIAISAMSNDMVRGALTRRRDSVEVLGIGVSGIVTFLGFTLLYKMFPHANVQWRTAFAGAAVAAVLWEIAKYGYELYLVHFARFNLVYGSVGAVIGLLLWGYISAAILLFGAELCAVLGRARAHDVIPT